MPDCFLLGLLQFVKALYIFGSSGDVTLPCMENCRVVSLRGDGAAKAARHTLSQVQLDFLALPEKMERSFFGDEFKLIRADTVRVFDEYNLV
jgi:hypothetical protein